MYSTSPSSPGPLHSSKTELLKNCLHSLSTSLPYILFWTHSQTATNPLVARQVHSLPITKWSIFSLTSLTLSYSRYGCWLHKHVVLYVWIPASAPQCFLAQEMIIIYLITQAQSCGTHSTSFFQQTPHSAHRRITWALPSTLDPESQPLSAAPERRTRASTTSPRRPRLPPTGFPEARPTEQPGSPLNVNHIKSFWPRTFNGSPSH